MDRDRIRERLPRVLECSSAGDRRFSALFARVRLQGQEASIEEWYQLAKRWRGEAPPKNWREAKGRYPAYLEIFGVVLESRLMHAWYDYLWWLYLSRRPELVAYAGRFDRFTDRFSRPGAISQAESIRLFVKEGPDAILGREDVRELLSALRGAGVVLPTT